MAVTIDTKTSDVISPEDLLSWALENIDPSDDDSMLEASEMLCALKNNRDFIVNKMRDQMKYLITSFNPEALSAQGTIHAAGSNAKGAFVIRSVVWTPPLTQHPRSRQLQDRTLSFALPHDHNFGLLTIGYFGPGYETEIYEYDRSRIVGYAGEHVDIEYLETTNLSEGKVLYFRRNKDIHTQLYPKDISISLNLMAQGKNIQNVPQYEFDTKNKVITSLLSGNTVEAMLFPFRMVKAIGGDANMVDVLESVALAHPSAHVRAAAFDTLLQIAPTERDRFFQLGFADKSPLVKHMLIKLQS